MSKHHALKEEARRRMKETGQNYQAALHDCQQQSNQGDDVDQSLRNADSREDYIEAVWDADLPDMVKVLLYELASRLDLTLPDWMPGSTHRVRFEEEELARAVGLDEEAANLCRYLAIEANWLVAISDGLVELRQPHEDWDLYQGALQDHKEPITDRALYRSRLAAFAADAERLESEPMMSVRRLREASVKVFGHTFVPKCVGGRFATSTDGLGTGRQQSKS
ncbi:hypothetical protein [Streptomyces sp. NPDC017949]|uniref:hypothetical protein n=1 Tax=Streptomyces sp. NPDC017949 TaxID=3365020 RepID=UPI0037A21BD0